jgi:hypothetical protein
MREKRDDGEYSGSFRLAAKIGCPASGCARWQKGFSANCSERSR